MCLVRVNGLVGTLPVSEAQIKAMNIRSDANITVYVSAIRFTKRQITFSLTPTTNNDLAVGSRVQCTVVKATAHHVFCTFPKRGRLYDAATVLGVLLEPPDRRAVPAGRPDQRRHHR